MTVRSPRREFRPAQDARYHGIPGGLPTPVPAPAPLRRTNNEADNAQYILAQYTYTMTSAPSLEICSSILRLDMRVAITSVYPLYSICTHAVLTFDLSHFSCMLSRFFVLTRLLSMSYHVLPCQDEPLLVSCGVVREQCQGTGIFLFVAEFCGWLMKHNATSGDHDKPDDDDKALKRESISTTC